MLKFQVSEDEQWMVLLEFEDEVEKRQIEISLTKKIHNPSIKNKTNSGSNPKKEIPFGIINIPKSLKNPISKYNR
jgi:hypothetical protein